MLEQLGQFHHENPLPLLEIPKKEPIKKLKLNLSHQGDLDIEADEVSEDNQKELTNLLLLVNADNLLRQRAITNITKDSSDAFTHMSMLVLLVGVILISLYFVSDLRRSSKTADINLDIPLSIKMF